MKKRYSKITEVLFATFFIISILLASSCTKATCTHNCVHGTCVSDNLCACSSGWTGYSCDVSSSSRYMMFWKKQAGSPITVTCEGQSGTVDLEYPSYTMSNAPGCNSDGCFTILLSQGSHSYTATDGVHTWNSTVNVTSNNCNTYLLYW